MITLLDQLTYLSYAMMLVFVRISMVLLLLPGISEKYVTIRHRIVVALILSTLLLPILETGAQVTDSEPSTILEALFWELLIGSVIGICIRSIVFCLQILGAIIAQSISLSQILGATVSSDAQTTVSNILLLAGLAIIMMSGFLESVLKGIWRSFALYPAGLPIDPQDILQLVVLVFSQVSELSLQFSAPFLLLAMYYHAVIAVVNRAMPQLLVSFIGVPAILIVAISLMVFSMGVILQRWNTDFFEFLELL